MPEPTGIPMTPLEDAIVLSERAWPLTIHLEARLDRAIDPTRLELGVRWAMAQHPLARARRATRGPLARVQHWSPRHASAVDPVAIAIAADDAELAAHRDSFLSTRIPTDESPLFRVLLVRAPSGDRLILAVHHGMCDGMGAVALLSSIAEGTARSAAQISITPDGDPYDEIARRLAPATPPEAAGKTARRTTGRTAGVRQTWRAVARRPHAARLAPVSPDTAAGRYHVVLDSVDAIALDAAATAARARIGAPVTRHDLVLAAMHHALTTHVHPEDRHLPITVTVPVTTRTRDERGRVVANLTLQATTRSTTADHADADTLLLALAAQMAPIRHGGVAHEPAAQLGGAGLLPARVRARLPALASVVTRDRFVDTSRLSQLGSVTIEGADHLGITEVWFSAPARMPQGLTIGTVVFDGRLHLAYRSCRELFDAAALDAFAVDVRRALVAPSSRPLTPPPSPPSGVSPRPQPRHHQNSRG